MMYLAIPMTVALFLAFRALHAKVRSPLCNPVLLTIAASAFILSAWHIDINEYRAHTQIFDYLLELAVVALAVPLYKQIHQLRRQLLLMFIAVAAGIITATTTAVVITSLLRVPEQLQASLASLAVTTPITLLVTEQLGGLGSIAASMVILIGIVGAIAGFNTLKLTGIRHKGAQGVALGGACHAIGTATAIADNETSAAYASAAMALSALLSPIIVPIYYPWLASLVL
ncbi:LrgB family protein [Pseudoalteromonas sp. CNC9-20]|uniref:LrgB family protein n=1 Tax=Pseudoalteromonas sp. CNC9-20 TaxID=2917750 RepID=UPI001EF6AFC6|nr:LrgB family protein [Pseudoalteromonas sp. CNC9-20]MCG7570888.1 LrgB family protein [Pseudoalteromonas sp. CNC9-20]